MATAADKKARIGVLGASGYTGAELVRLLLRHPRAEIALLTADRRAGQAMRQVFPQVFVIDTAGFGNQILVGVNQPVGDGVLNFQKNFERMQIPVLKQVMSWSLNDGPAPMREFLPTDVRFAPFTDDHAPVEQLIDSLIFDQIK